MDNKLIVVSENGIFYRIKNFFCELFNKKNMVKVNDKAEQIIENKNNQFNNNGEIVKLLNQYRSGIISAENLSSEQVLMMCKLYDDQINNLKKLNESKKRSLLKYREKK